MTTIESEEFYNYCQAYRHAPITDQQATINAYENLIAYIDGFLLADKELAKD